MKPLDGCFAKLERAKEQTKRLERRTKVFLKSDAYRVVGEIDSETGEYVARMRILKNAPLQWSVIAGEIIHDLRSSLDHFMWQLVIRSGNTPSDTTQFPILDEPQDFSKRSVMAQTKGLDDVSLAFIKSLQPYHRRQHIRRHPLWTLRELSNIEKHRTLLTPGPIFIGGKFVGAGTPLGDFFERVASMFGIYEDGAEIFRGQIPTGIDPAMSMYFEPFVAISFSRRTAYRKPIGAPPFPGIFEIIADYINDRVFRPTRPAFGYE